MYPRIRRPAALYRRSLEVLGRAADWGAVTKSGLMVGLGETASDLHRALDDLRAASVRLLTIGQYLQPTRGHVPVVRYVPPEEFESLRDRALALGFADVEAGPLVRSSYRAARLAAAMPRPPEEERCAT
jgi:lipoic acid synthetase